MFEQAADSLKKVTEQTVEMQQEMFKKWLSLWQGFPAMPTGPWMEQMKKFQQRWSETVGEMVRRQRETLDTQYKAGMQNIEKAFQLSQAKSPEEMRTQTMELWQKCFEGVRQTYETQVKEFQLAMQKWMELLSKPSA